MTVRKPIMLGTAGHVDHGKTALVKLLTGCETDTLRDEKERGLTIDLGFAPCRLGHNRVVGLVDVPGHADFIRNMVAGAHGIDLVLFVVAADDGIMPQTREHLQILNLMGVRQGIVALTKIDLVPSPQDRARLDQALRQFLAGTFLQNAPICPLSNITGEGFAPFFETLGKAVELCPERSGLGLFHMWIEDAFSIRGAGTVVTGIPVRGAVRLGDSITLQPGGVAGHVRRMQVYGEDAQEGRAGECVALNIPELNLEQLRRGLALSGGNTALGATIAEARIELLPDLKAPLRDMTELSVHVGTAAVSARLALLENAQVEPGQVQFGQLRLENPIAALPGERFILRANVSASGQTGLTTVGGGRLLRTGTVRLRRNKPWVLELLRGRAAAIDQPVHWCEQLLRENLEPVGPADLQSKTMARPEELAAMLGELTNAGRIIKTPGGAWVHADLARAKAAEIVAQVERFHAAEPARMGLSRSELSALCGFSPELFELALETALRARDLLATGSVLARPGRSTALSQPDQQLLGELLGVFQRAGWTTPAPAELAPRFGKTPQQIQKLLTLLVDSGRLVRLDENLWMHQEAIDKARQLILELFSRARSFTTMQFRDTLGVSRKFAVPLLDYLDRTKFTVRSGHDRTPGAEARARMG